MCRFLVVALALTIPSYSFAQDGKRIAEIQGEMAKLQAELATLKRSQPLDERKAEFQKAVLTFAACIEFQSKIAASLTTPTVNNSAIGMCQIANRHAAFLKPSDDYDDVVKTMTQLLKTAQQSQTNITASQKSGDKPAAEATRKIARAWLAQYPALVAPEVFALREKANAIK